MRLYDDALALEAAGCFAIVLEAMPGAGRGADHRGARRSRRSGSAPGRRATGRCSSGTTCSGSTRATRPRFVKRYADLATAIREAVGTYVEEVRERRFPEEQHTYAMPEEELARFEEALHDRLEVRERR